MVAESGYFATPPALDDPLPVLRSQHRVSRMHETALIISFDEMGFIIQCTGTQDPMQQTKE